MSQLVTFEECPPGPFIFGGGLMLKTTDGQSFRICDGLPFTLPGAIVEPVHSDDLQIFFW